MASSFESLLNPNEIRLNLEAPNLGEELTRFNELFELLLANSRETDLDEAVKVARWKILAGESARKKLRECQWEPGEKVTIESMTAKLVKGIPTSETSGSIFVARKAFWRRECKPGEGFSAWLADLGAMLTRCSYEKPNEVLRDKIVCFHPDDELSAQLVVLDKDVSLDTVIAKCRTHELTHKHQAEQVVSNNRKRKHVDAMEQDRDEDNVQADEPQDQQKIPKKCEDSGDVVLRDQSLMEIPGTKPFMLHPRNACNRCRRQSRRAAATARKQEAIAVAAEKVKLESAVGLMDGAESTPAAAAAPVDEEAEDGTLGDGLLVHRASPPDAAEEVTAPAGGVLASHSLVRIVDISRLLEKEAQKKDVGIVAKTVPDITVGAITTAADQMDTKVNVATSMNQNCAKVAVDTNVNRKKKKKIDDVLIPKAESDAVPRKSRGAAKKARKRERRLLLAAVSKELEGCTLGSGRIGNNGAGPSTLSNHNGQQKSPDSPEGKMSASAAGAHVPQESTNCLQQVAGDAIDIKKNVGATVNSNVKVSKPIANANKQKKKKKIPDGKIQKPAKKSNWNKRKNAHVHNIRGHEWQQHAPIPWEWGWEPYPVEWGWMGNNWAGPSTWPGHNNWQQKRRNAPGGKKSAPTRGNGPQQESVNRPQQQKEAKMMQVAGDAVHIKVEVDDMMDLDVKVNMPIVDGQHTGEGSAKASSRVV